MTVTFGAPRRLEPGQGRADSTLTWADVAGKPVFVLRQIGTFADICHDHGRLLAPQIETGVFPEILDTIRVDTDGATATMDWINDAIYRRISDEVFEAASPEFRAGINALAEGYFAALDNPAFGARDVRDAAVAIDVGNIATGLARRMTKPLAPEAGPTIEYILGAAKRYRSGRGTENPTTAVIEQPGRLRDAVQNFARQRRRIGFGCTGAAIARGAVQGGSLHARNFDGGFFAWNTHPGLFLIDERAGNPAWHRYAAIGTAGLPYPGGISGINDAGIAVSLHQMSTVSYQTGRPGYGFDIAPFLQQRILREAGTLEQAVKILKSARHFGAWTILVSDVQSGRCARVEISGAQVSAKIADHRLSQSNHFLARGMVEGHDFFADAHFTPTLGKWLETRARMTTVEAAWDAPIDVDWAIGLLAGHADGALGGARRSFGRTVCKAYGLMSSIACADADRARAADQIWMTVGDRAPGPQSAFAGFALDWGALAATPVAERPVRRAKTVDPEFAEALGHYVTAFATLARPRGPDGAYLGRAPDAGEEAALRRAAIAALDRAIAGAEDAGLIDPAFRYVRARLRHAARDFAGAAQDWDFLRDYGRMAVPMLDYERALIAILGAATDAALGRPVEPGLAAGEALLEAAARRLFPGRQPRHKGIADWQKTIAAIRADGAGADLPDLDFVTVE